MMKKLLMTGLLFLSINTFAQVIAKGISPASIAVSNDFRWAMPTNSWATADLNIPGNFVQDTLVLVDDGTPGVNATYGNPLSAEGCNPSPANAYDGKIAVLYRNSCAFGDKALYAEQSGAVGVIIINREDDLLNILGGTNGAMVTVPTIIIENTDGIALLAEMLNGPVEYFIGNKGGVFQNDLNLSKSAALVSKTAVVPVQLAQSSSEYGFEMGAKIKNVGSTDVTNVVLNAKVLNPSGATVYDETVSNLSILAGDSIDVFPGLTNILPAFSLSSYPLGEYKIQYTTSSSATDAEDSDNLFEANFFISDSLYSFAPLDANGLPVNTGGFRPSSNTSTYSTCVHMNDPNLGRIQAEGVYFASTPRASNPFDLTGEEMIISVFEWTTIFTDLDDPNFGIDLLGVDDTIWYYPSDLPGEYVYVPFSSPIDLQDDTRYLVCVQTSNIDLFISHNSEADYTWNNLVYRQPLYPIENDGSFFALGFGTDSPSAIAVKIGQNTVGIDENEELLQGKLYPNPTSAKFAIELELTGMAQLNVTDLSGKLVLSKGVSFVNGKTVVDMDGIEKGMYVVTVVSKAGATARFNLVKE